MKNRITFIILFILLGFYSLQAQVTQEWVARYNNPGNTSDYARSLAVDDSGNVYITGNTYITSGDYATIKYNSSGVQQWIQRYTGGLAWSIAVDGSGNVYVTGENYLYGRSEYATIKYNSSGVQKWAQRYHGPGPYRNVAWSLAVDDSENVYVSGYSTGSDFNYDIATIKYNSSGIQQWVQRYGPANPETESLSLAVDGSGNVYVTGSSSNSTIKYNSSGVLLWAMNGIDCPTSIAVDDSKNVYATGWDYGDGTDGDFATIKYDSSGVQQWAQRYNGPGNSHDWAFSLAVDGSGNVYVTGFSTGSGFNYDYATIKYNSSGVQQWVQRYNGRGNSSDEARSLAIDSSGNVYVTGSSGGSETSSDYATIKYNSSGVQQWVQIYNRQGNGNDQASSLAVDNSGNVYVTGSSDGSGTGRDYATIKYSQTEGITAPSDLEAQSVDSSFIKVTWQDNSNDEDGFYIERTLINDSSHWEVIDAVPQNVNQYSDYFVTRGLKYYYRVKAYSGNIFSGYSNTDSAILGGEPALIPAPPSKLTFLKRTPKAISMGWQDNSGNENGFIIFRKSESDLFFKIIDSVNTDVVTYQEVGVSPNLNYYYKVCSFNASGISDYSNTLFVSAKSIPVKTPKLSGKSVLFGNYPNPFNPVTNLEFGISDLGFVSLKIYDMLGKEVATLVNANLIPGTYKYNFDASALPSGVYFYKLTVDGNIIDSKRMVLLK